MSSSATASTNSSPSARILRRPSKTLKDVKIATFSARAEILKTKPFFRDAFKRTRELIRRRTITSGRIRRKANSPGILLLATARQP
jgi:hypothetical protein